MFRSLGPVLLGSAAALAPKVTGLNSQQGPCPPALRHHPPRSPLVGPPGCWRFVTSAASPPPPRHTHEGQSRGSQCLFSLRSIYSNDIFVPSTLGLLNARVDIFWLLALPGITRRDPS